MTTLSCKKTYVSTQAQLNAEALKKLTFKAVSVLTVDYKSLLFIGDQMAIDGNGLASIHGSGSYSGSTRAYNLGEMKGYDLDTFGNLTLYF